jgi:hypothetical protein
MCILAVGNHRSQTSFQPSSFISAGFRAVTTLAFVAPSLVLPRLMEQLRQDLDPSGLESIGLTEYGIWKTPTGTTFVDGKTHQLIVML